MSRTLKLNWVRILVFSLFTVPFAWGQAGGASGSVSVTVVDATGSAVVAAVARLRELGSRTVRMARSKDVGNYRCVKLPLGAYSLSVKKVGFEMQVFSNVIVPTAQPTALSAALRMGAATQ